MSSRCEDVCAELLLFWKFGIDSRIVRKCFWFVSVAASLKVSLVCFVDFFGGNFGVFWLFMIQMFPFSIIIIVFQNTVC